jgi:hypothetical protein
MVAKQLKLLDAIELTPSQKTRVHGICAPKVKKDGTLHRYVSEAQARLIVLASDAKDTDIRHFAVSVLFDREWYARMFRFCGGGRASTRRGTTAKSPQDLVRDQSNTDEAAEQSAETVDDEKQNVISGPIPLSKADEIAHGTVQEIFQKIVHGGKLVEFRGDAAFISWCHSFTFYAKKEVRRAQLSLEGLSEHEYQAANFHEIRKIESFKNKERMAAGTTSIPKKLLVVEKFKSPSNILIPVLSRNDGDESVAFGDVYDSDQKLPEEILEHKQDSERRFTVLRKTLSEFLKSQDIVVGEIILIWLEYAQTDRIRPIKRARDDEAEIDGKVTFEQIAEKYNAQRPEDKEEINGKTVYDVIKKFQRELTAQLDHS